MRFLRSLLFNILLFGSGLFGSLWGHVLLRVAPARLLPFGQAWARLILRTLRLICGIRVQVTGLENLPIGAALIASQHQSAFDTLVWLTLVAKPSYILKQELTRMPLFGGLILPSGQIALDRDGGAVALRGLLKQTAAAAAAGRQLIIFPEGTRVAPGVRGTLQPGIAAMAKATGLPVIPVSTDSGLFWGRNAFGKSPGTLHIHIHPPLQASLQRADLLARLEDIFYAAPVDKTVGQAAGML